jgi:hypothetical protein
MDGSGGGTNVLIVLPNGIAPKPGEDDGMVIDAACSAGRSLTDG